MEDLFFWKRWGKPYTGIYLISFCLFIAVISGALYEYAQGESNLFSWETEKELKGVGLTLDGFQRHFLAFKQEAEQYVFVESFKPKVEKSSSKAAYLFLLALTFATVLVLVAITYMRKVLWFALSMTVFIAWIVMMKLDLHGILGVGNQYFTFIVILAFIFAAYYFFALNNNAGILSRFAVFFTLFALLGVAISTTSELSLPFVHLANYGVMVPIVVSFLFVFSISYEIIRGVLYLVSNSVATNSKMGLINLLVFCVLYLGNLFLMYMNLSGKMNWELAFLNPFILVFVSIILGFWGFKKKSEIYMKVLPFHPVGAYFYLGLATIAVACLSYAFATYNQSMIEVYENAIVYGHLGMGFSFLAYLLFNFLPELMHGVPFYEKLYDSKHIPFYTVMLTGAMIIFVLLSKVYYSPINTLKGAYYNFIGDVYAIDNNPLLAKNYYTRGANSDGGNLKSNLSLALLHYEDQEFDKAIKALKSAKRHNESPFIYALISEVYKRQGSPLIDKLEIEQGLSRFPNSGELWNNYGVSYFKVKGIDSSLFYFHKAAGLLENPEVANINTFAYIVDRQEESLANEVLKNEVKSSNVSLIANYSALANLAQQPLESFYDDLLLSPSIKQEQMSYINNYLLGASTVDAKTWLPRLKQLRSNNPAYSNNLRFLEFKLLMNKGELVDAKTVGDSILSNCSQELYPYYSNFIGTSFLKAERYTIASYYLQRSYNMQQFYSLNEAPFHYALNKVLRFDEGSYDQLKQCINLRGSNYQEEAGLYWSIMNLSEDPAVWSDLKDENKLYLVLFQLPYWKDALLFDVLASISNENIKAKTIAVMIEYYLSRNQIDLANKAWAQIPNQNLDIYTINSLNFLYLEKILREGKAQELKERAKLLELNSDKKIYRSYYEGIALAYLGEVQEAEVKLLEAEQKIQLHEGVYWNLIEFEAYVKKDRQKAYEKSLEALGYFPESIPLLKQYVGLCEYLNYEGFVNEGLERLYNLLPENDYQAFLLEFEEVKKDAQQEFENWE